MDRRNDRTDLDYDAELLKEYSKLKFRFTSGGFRAAIVPARPSLRDAYTTEHVIGVNFEPGEAVEAVDGGEKVKRVIPADSVGFIPGNLHLTVEAEHVGERVYVSFTNEIIDKYFARVGVLGHDLVFLPFTHDPEAALIGRAIQGALSRQSECSEAYLESLCASLVLSIAQRFGAPAQAKTGPGRLSKARVKTIVEFIEARFSEDLGLPDMAEAAALSTYHFARCFKNTFGKSPHAYLIERRLREAQTLLRDSDLSIAEVAFSSGFKTQAHFATVFKSHFDATPAAWRREKTS